MRQRLRFTLSPDYWPLEMLADKDWPGVTSWVKARPRCLWNQYENRSEHPGLSKRLKPRPSKRPRAATSREPRQGFYLYKPLISQTRCPGRSFNPVFSGNCRSVSLSVRMLPGIRLLFLDISSERLRVYRDRSPALVLWKSRLGYVC